MPLQTKHRFSVKDYNRMAETGVLRPDARVELLDGEIIDRSAIGPFHGSIVIHLNELFGQLAKGRWLVVNQDPLRLDDQSEPEPDLMLVKRSPDFYKSRHPLRKMCSC
jgi:Uma2 family endonuclease